MPTALVTGGLGRSGRWIVDRLARDGHDVVCADLDHPGFEVDGRDRIDFRAVDLTDRGQALDLVREVDPDVAVHWAAIPSPTRHPGGRVFENNVASAYNALTAAGEAGARVAWASSESAYGNPFREEPEPPEWLPVTEDHPMRPEDPYGTSKVAGEEIAKMVARRYDVPVASVRPSWIQYPGEYRCLAGQDDPAAGVGNYWSYVDVRDVASAVAAILDAHLEGHEAFNVAAPDNYMDRPTVELFEETFGEVPEPCEVVADESALSTAKAMDLLDWAPEHAWRSADDDGEPSLT